jgi:hypothetical protein
MSKYNKYRSLAALSGDFNGDAAGTTASGTGLPLRNVEHGSLSVYADISAYTNTFTIAGYWEVSDDDSTYIKVVPLNNAAIVVFATGTGAAVTADVVVSCPSECWGWKYARFTVIAGVTTGANAADSYALTYRWLESSNWV